MLFKCLALLDGFNSDVAELSFSFLNGDFKIRKVAKDELEKFMLSRQYLPFRDLLGFVVATGKDRYWIEHSYEIEDTPVSRIEAFNQEDDFIAKFILVLRLFRPGDIRNIFTVKRIGGRYNFPFRLKYVARSRESRVNFFRKTELAQFQVFYEDIANVAWKQKESNSSVSVALNRFMDGYERVRLEDKIIDYMVGLEALYLRGNGMGEFGYKMSHRVSVLLSDKKKQRQLFDDMKDAYNLRSRIVHGGKYELKLKDVWFVEDTLRESIKRLLRVPKPNWLELVFGH